MLSMVVGFKPKRVAGGRVSICANVTPSVQITTSHCETAVTYDLRMYTADGVDDGDFALYEGPMRLEGSLEEVKARREVNLNCCNVVRRSMSFKLGPIRAQHSAAMKRMRRLLEAREQEVSLVCTIGICEPTAQPTPRRGPICSHAPGPRPELTAPPPMQFGPPRLGQRMLSFGTSTASPSLADRRSGSPAAHLQLKVTSDTA
mmetsp:Transcript_10637/g.31688  ORF Transcript_10637/g.31688 Transcript_10637/m.31688 type:complete len:203 (-) Transcript_10637:125-733(-)